MPSGSIYTFVGVADLDNATRQILTSQGIVSVGQWGYFLPNEVNIALGQGLILQAGIVPTASQGQPRPFNAVLTGNSADDAYALSAGTGQKLSVSGGTNLDSWANNAVVTNEPAPHLLMSSYDTGGSDQTTAIRNALADAATLITANGLSLVEIIANTRRKFTVGGPVIAGANGQWAQIPLPFSNAASGTIRLAGVPRGNDYSYLSPGNSGTVIESTLASAPAYNASVGIASIFGGPASFCSTRTPPTMYPNGFSYLKFATRDITIRSASPVICGIDAGWMTGFGFDGLLQFDTDQMAAFSVGSGFSGLTVCTAPQAIPLILPFHLDWYGALGDTLVCSGWLGGPMLGEYAHIKRLIVFFSAGAALYVDAGNQPSRIEFLTDWNNAYGIATTSPSSATPISPTATATGSGNTNAAIPPSPIDIGTWEVQTSQGGSAPAATQRVYDKMDANDLVTVDCLSWASTTDAPASNPAPVILSIGASTTGRALTTRIQNKNHLTSGGLSPSMPASGTAIRNPYGRNALAQIVGGTVSAVTVNDGATGVTTFALVPMNASMILTYSVAPTWKWQLM
jgi:hypothetical protein